MYPLLHLPRRPVTRLVRWLVFSVWAGAIVAGAVYGIACGGGLTDADKAALVRDRHLAMYGYAHADGGALSAEMRAILCDQEATLLRNGVAVDDAGVRCR